MDRDSPRRRHVWVDLSGGYRHPGLVIVWRRHDDSWERYVHMYVLGDVAV
jgi:hypothetical protein